MPLANGADGHGSDVREAIRLIRPSGIVKAGKLDRAEVTVRRLETIASLVAADEAQEALTALAALIEALEQRDPYTAGHSMRVALICKLIGEALALDPDEEMLLQLEAWLHDVGKLGVRDEVLHKPGPLDPLEWQEIKHHPAIGAKLVELLHGLRETMPPIHQHHERMDGTGYPDGCPGPLIHPHARIIAVADAIDSMSSARPYRPPLPEERILEELRGGRGTQFDPEILDVVLDELWPEIRKRLRPPLPASQKN